MGGGGYNAAKGLISRDIAKTLRAGKMTKGQITHIPKLSYTKVYSRELS
jgi:hypothetical protein